MRRSMRQEIIEFAEKTVKSRGKVSVWEIMEQFGVSYSYAYQILRFLSETNSDYQYFKNTLIYTPRFGGGYRNVRRFAS